MHKKELGFVLKRFLPNRNKLSVLSQNLGKIEIITRPSEKTLQLWPGMLLEFYCLKKNCKVSLVQNLEIIMSPYYDHILDVNWVHQLLEVCYYFSPVCNPAEEIFRHLYGCFNIQFFKNFFYSELYIIKKIYFLKLLELLGFYPSKDLVIYLSLYQELSSMYVNFVDKDNVKLLKTNLKKIGTVHIQVIDNWIKHSLIVHPNFKHFKAINIKN